MGSALELLGADYRFHTRVYRTGADRRRRRRCTATSSSSRAAIRISRDASGRATRSPSRTWTTATAAPTATASTAIRSASIRELAAAVAVARRQADRRARRRRRQPVRRGRARRRHGVRHLADHDQRQRGRRPRLAGRRRRAGDPRRFRRSRRTCGSSTRPTTGTAGSDIDARHRIRRRRRRRHAHGDRRRQRAGGRETGDVGVPGADAEPVCGDRRSPRRCTSEASSRRRALNEDKPDLKALAAAYADGERGRPSTCRRPTARK